MKSLDLNQMESINGGSCSSTGANVLFAITAVAGLALMFTPAAPIGTSLIWGLTSAVASTGTVAGAGCVANALIND